jgi:RimJ/RimL family protein N-acetyltransferase
MSFSTDVTELHTGRLVLRPVTMADADAYLDIFSDARSMLYWSCEPIERLDEAKELTRQDIEWAELETCINWGMALSDTNRLIGKVNLFQISRQNRRAEIGYILDRRHWGKGYMSEAMARVLAYAFDTLKLHRIEADTDPENTPSLALLDRFGFTREGVFRDRWYVHGKWHDSVMLGLLLQDYRASLITES